MIIKVNDKTNSAKMLYYQSLALLFLPCEKFGVDCNQNKMYVDAFEKDGNYFVSVSLVVGDKSAKASMNECIRNGAYSQMKNLIGRTILCAFYEIFQIRPAWGISTGVKPVKLAKTIRSNCQNNDVKTILENDYLVSHDKANLTLNALKLEDKVMASMSERACSIYVSIPFCPSKCHYCSFVSCTTPRLLSLIPDYLIKLEKELQLIAQAVSQNDLEVVSVYVGGGTPAILNEKQIVFLLEAISRHFNLSDKLEFSFEAGRPDCITTSKLAILKNYGVNRVSINTQSTNDDVLKHVGRNHTYDQFVKAFESARKIGFDNINTDLIAGLPGESLSSFKRSVDDLCLISPDNVTIHAFTLKKSSDYREDNVKDFQICTNDAQEMIDYSYRVLSDNLYVPYYVYRQKNTVANLDNTGYCKNNKECIYNIVTMGEYHTVLAAGAGAVTKLVSKDTNTVERIFSPKYPYEFLDQSKYSGFKINSVSEFYTSKY